MMGREIGLVDDARHVIGTRVYSSGFETRVDGVAGNIYRPRPALLVTGPARNVVQVGTVR
jgi:hypothetical protein